VRSLESVIRGDEWPGGINNGQFKVRARVGGRERDSGCFREVGGEGSCVPV
jgi:hypothetical protein